MIAIIIIICYNSTVNKVTKILATQEKTSQPVATEVVEATPAIERQRWLQELLGPDYETSHELIDQFAYNPETGEDALRHILSGDMIKFENGVLAMGFHHEPSAGPDTYVIPSIMAFDGVTHKVRKKFARRPFEPYRAKTVVGGHAKVGIHYADDGSLSIMPQESSMFPKEYDALAVMKTIVNARDNRDTQKDQNDDRNGVITDGQWQMLDGETMMKLKLRLNAKSGKIEGATPIVKGYMNLTPDAINVHLGLLG